MPRQNRVQPTGDILAHPARGAFMGNRGILHDADGQLGPARWRHKAWVTCVLRFKNRRRALMQPGHYTELFFHDEAVALAAGHRPCGECRRADYLAYRAAVGARGTVDVLDAQMHAERAVPRLAQQNRHVMDLADLPDGAFILQDETPCLVVGASLYPFSPAGYGPARPRPTSGKVTVLTPPTSIRALNNGYKAMIRL
ncbi:hypothetical protein [Arenibacterium halophilum]|uniref:Metal binding domain of Ada n=1 Tax=Arenibacterium halophilum TaxID=2583821 RepID=A0ABY2XBU2_9RHOB|nr:hypothetical protein [Arenibacterium halophilum]TMV14480.1 hypothetical protein FGK64_00370 [Arenibacterium halophilum]